MKEEGEKMNLIIKNADDVIIQKSNGISIPQQIAYTSVDDLFIEGVEYCIFRKTFNTQDNELEIIVDKAE